jgi:hypothetical protein
MNWGTGAAIAEVTSAIGVIITLAYLAYQISQTNRIAKSAVVRELQQSYEALYTLVASDLDMAELVAKLREKNYAATSAVEEERLDNFAILVASNWFSAQVAYDKGQFDANTFKIYCEDVEAKLTQWPGLAPYIKKAVERFPSATNFEILEPVFQIEPRKSV